MKIPYVIDNQTHRLVVVLNELLAGHAGKSLNVATAYFTAGAFGMLKEGLLATVFNLAARYASGGEAAKRPTRRLERENLQLICFDHVCS
jgi:hypothetical protein